MRLYTKYIIGLFFLSCLIFGNDLVGQEMDIRFEKLPEHLVASNAGLINVIFEDTKGYIWIGTLGALIRYDGYEEKIFTHEPGDSLSISDSKISRIKEDPYGYLWIKTQNGLNRYNPATETFERIYHELESGSDLKLDFAFPIGFFDDYLWVNTRKGLCKYDLKKKEYDHSHHQIASNKMLIDTLYNTFISKDNDFLLFKNSGFYLYDSRKLDFQFFKLKFKTTDTNEGYYIMENPEGSIWLGSEKALHLFNPKSKTLHKLNGFPPYHLPMRKEWHTFYIKDKNGIDWMGTDKGVFLFNHEKQFVRQLKHHPEDSKTLSSNRVSRALEDRQGNIWIGNQGGINIYNPNRKPFNSIKTDEKNKTLFIRESFEIETGKLLLWEGNQLMEIDYQNKKRKPFQYSPKTNLEQWNTGIICYYKDSRGLIWMGMGRGDVFIYNPVLKHYEFLKLPGELPFTGAGNMIGDIIEDAYGDIWISTWGNGVFRYTPFNKSFKHYVVIPNDSTSLLTNQARIMFVDSYKTLWISTRNGLEKFNYDTESFTHYCQDSENPNSISNHTAFCIYESPEGDFWIGTFGGGLNKMDRAKGTFEHYTMKDGLTNNGISGIYPDTKGNLWLLTGAGINVFNPKSKTFSYYVEKDGLKNKFHNAFAHYRSPVTGLIFAEGTSGIDYFHPDSIKANPFPPKMLITNLKLNNENINIAKTKTQKNHKSEFFIGSHISHTKHLSIPPDKQVITFGFTAIHYESSENNQYAYQLEGFDKDWQYVGTKREATYTNLDPGNYTFKVKAANPDGIWNETPAIIELTVLPPWWRTWWAYTFYVVSIIGSIWWYIQNLNKKLQREQAHNKELSDLNAANQRFVPNDFLKILGKKSIKDLQLGDQIHTKMTILFSDIRDYTPLSESMTPEENFKFINAYLGRVGPIIKEHGGFISSYLGDGLMALFVNEPQNAIAATIAMQKELEVYNEERRAENKRPLRTGMGLNTGDLMLGVIGDEHRYESTVISDAVNTASRMEGLTKVFGAAIIFSEKTLLGLLDNFPLSNKLSEEEKLLDNRKLSSNSANEFAYRYLGKVKVKGKDKALKIYDLYEGETVNIRELKAQTKLLFEQGIDYYFNRQFGKSAECLKQVLAVHENDKAAQYYLDKSVEYIVNGVSEEWSGVEEMVMK